MKTFLEISVHFFQSKKVSSRKYDSLFSSKMAVNNRVKISYVMMDSGEIRGEIKKRSMDSSQVNVAALRILFGISKNRDIYLEDAVQSDAARSINRVEFPDSDGKFSVANGTEWWLKTPLRIESYEGQSGFSANGSGINRTNISFGAGASIVPSPRATSQSTTRHFGIGMQRKPEETFYQFKIGERDENGAIVQARDESGDPMEVSVKLTDVALSSLRALKEAISDAVRSQMNVIWSETTFEIHRTNGSKMLDSPEWKNFDYWKGSPKGKRFHFVVQKIQESEDSDPEEEHDYGLRTRAATKRKSSGVSSAVKPKPSKLAKKKTDNFAKTVADAVAKYLNVPVNRDGRGTNAGVEGDREGARAIESTGGRVENSDVAEMKRLLSDLEERLKCRLCYRLSKTMYSCTKCRFVVACKECFVKWEDKLKDESQDDRSNGFYVNSVPVFICPNCQRRSYVKYRKFFRVELGYEMDAFKQWGERHENGGESGGSHGGGSGVVANGGGASAGGGLDNAGGTIEARERNGDSSDENDGGQFGIDSEDEEDSY